DGLLYVLWSEQNPWVYYSILWSTGIPALCAPLFTVYFLGLEHTLRRWELPLGGISLALLVLPIIYILTSASIWYHLLQMVCSLSLEHIHRRWKLPLVGIILA